ncbi:hypothetical protein CDD82_7536 [Ophiocordyceps australis]|uniref:Long-chain-alcohol oxidase n=1 Tax=Ophiocordyceps australis TaxID=1399860 RepID=A0A2C5XV51_9HYPO|nr:hypothetical protein CDD82_7536 [Ophiocordyceps australis]
MHAPLQHQPVAVPMPSPPSNDFMSEQQWDTLFALIDGCLPSISTDAPDHDRLGLAGEELDGMVQEISRRCKDGPSKDQVKAFLQARPSQDSKLRAECIRTLSTMPQRTQLATALRLLSTRHGSLLLTGSWTPITAQPVTVREAIVRSWCDSWLPSLRMLAKGVVAAAQKANSMSSPYFAQLSGYNDVPRNWKAGEGYKFDFIQLAPGSQVHEMMTDVVVIGSGCGGAVAAKNLAEAGHQVLVVDKGYYFPTSHLPMAQDAACHYLYDHCGLWLTDDASTNILSGSSWGGGGTINWSVCFRLQDFVRREWAAQGLPLFESAAFDECMDRVWDFVGASTSGIRHNHRNQVMLDGCRKLGWKGRTVEQNTANKEHYCGQCHLGCGSAEKRGPTVAWLPAAAEAGADFLEGFNAERIIFADDGVTATGVEGVWTARDDSGQVHRPASCRTQRRVRIRAKRVVLAAGSIRSPVMLIKSGVDNPSVGRNLHLHPCNIVTATYDDETRPWEGGIITSYSGEFENLDCEGHGVKLEPIVMVPYTLYATQPWRGGLDAKQLLLRYANLASFIVLTRDRDSGRVYMDRKTGEPRIDYTPSDFDRDHTLEGVQAMAKICYVTGAKEIRAGLPRLEPWVPLDNGERQRRHVEGKDPEFTDPAFGAWLQRLRQVDNRPPETTFASAHQMGSCRMSSSPETGVVDERGAVWGTRNLFVADASVFPSASGVNPMLTVMSLADWISRCVIKDLAAGGN